MARKKDTTEPKKEEIIVTDELNTTLKVTFDVIITSINVIEKRLDKTIEILDKLLKLKKHQMGIYE